MSALRIDSRRSSDTLHLRLEGELDLAAVAEVEEHLGRDRDASTILIDLREVTFIDSSGLRAVVIADRDAREAGRRCVVIRGPEAVDRVFRLTGVDERLEFVDDPAAVSS